MNKMILFLTAASVILQSTIAMEKVPSKNNDSLYDALVRKQISEYEAIQRRRAPELKFDGGEENAQLAEYQRIQQKNQLLLQDEAGAKELAKQFAVEAMANKAPEFTEEDRQYLTQLQEQFGQLEIKSSSADDEASYLLALQLHHEYDMPAEYNNALAKEDGFQGDDASFAMALQLQEEWNRGGPVEEKDDGPVVLNDGDYSKGCEIIKNMPHHAEIHNTQYPHDPINVAEYGSAKTMDFMSRILVAEMGISYKLADAIIKKILMID